MLPRTIFLMLAASLVSASAKAEDAAGETGSNADKASLQQNVARCLSAPSGKARVRIAFVLKADGTVDGAPRILDGAEDPQGKTFALSAVRAILRCMPYAGTSAGKVVATFSQTDD